MIKCIYNSSFIIDNTQKRYLNIEFIDSTENPKPYVQFHADGIINKGAASVISFRIVAQSKRNAFVQLCIAQVDDNVPQDENVEKTHPENIQVNKFVYHIKWFLLYRMEDNSVKGQLLSFLDGMNHGTMTWMGTWDPFETPQKDVNDKALPQAPINDEYFILTGCAKEVDGEKLAQIQKSIVLYQISDERNERSIQTIQVVERSFISISPNLIVQKKKSKHQNNQWLFSVIAGTVNGRNVCKIQNIVLEKSNEAKHTTWSFKNEGCEQSDVFICQSGQESSQTMSYYKANDKDKTTLCKDTIGHLACLCYAGVLHDKNTLRSRCILVGGLNWDMTYLYDRRADSRQKMMPKVVLVEIVNESDSNNVQAIFYALKNENPIHAIQNISYKGDADSYSDLKRYFGMDMMNGQDIELECIKDSIIMKGDMKQLMISSSSAQSEHQLWVNVVNDSEKTLPNFAQWLSIQEITLNAQHGICVTANTLNNVSW